MAYGPRGSPLLQARYRPILIASSRRLGQLVLPVRHFNNNRPKVSGQASSASATARSPLKAHQYNKYSRNNEDFRHTTEDTVEQGDKKPASMQDRLALLKSMQSASKWDKPAMSKLASNGPLQRFNTVRDRGHAPVTNQWTNTEPRQHPESPTGNNHRGQRFTSQPFNEPSEHHSASKYKERDNSPNLISRNNYQHRHPQQQQQQQQQQQHSQNSNDGLASHWAKRKQLDRERQARRNQSSRLRVDVKQQGEEVEAIEAKTTKKQQPVVKTPVIREVFIPDTISVANLSRLLGVRMQQLIEKMNTAGLTVTAYDHVLTAEEASLVVMEFGYLPVLNNEAAFDLFPRPIPADMSGHPLRPPVVTVMGHVDHGKTSLLDALRKTSVAAGEAGGITQHIGAFSVVLPSKQRITFLDTPGHAAFCAMRARGAHTTDIVVLVVAADDSVMPQTIEAIQHAQAAKVPVIVAINKCDKHDANPKKVKEDLLRYEVQLEEYGGDTQVVEVSAVTGAGLEELEENIIVQAEMLDLRAENTTPAEGIILESGVDKGLGNVATVLVKRGSLKPGMAVLAGTAHGRARLMINDQGAVIKEAGPGTPVKLTGWKNLPAAGDELLVADSEDLAKKAVQNRLERVERQKEMQDLEAINEKRRVLREESTDEEGPDVTAPTIPELPLVIKGDVSGTVEAVVASLQGLPSNKARLNIIQSNVGAITESDVDLAAAAQGTILGFNVKCDKRVQAYARTANVKIVTHTVIYRLIEEAKSMLLAQLPKVYEPNVTGEARILQLFAINVKGRQHTNIAGCRVTNGVIKRGEKFRILRNQEIIFEGQLETLKNVKKDISEAGKGLECGMSFIDFQDFQPDDMIQSYIMVEKAQSL